VLILREWSHLVRLLLPLLESFVSFFDIFHLVCKESRLM
jgi:hypothetical protein